MFGFRRETIKKINSQINLNIGLLIQYYLIIKNWNIDAINHYCANSQYLRINIFTFLSFYLYRLDFSFLIDNFNQVSIMTLNKERKDASNVHCHKSSVTFFRQRILYKIERERDKRADNAI